MILTNVIIVQWSFHHLKFAHMAFCISHKPDLHSYKQSLCILCLLTKLCLGGKSRSWAMVGHHLLMCYFKWGQSLDQINYQWLDTLSEYCSLSNEAHTFLIETKSCLQVQRCNMVSNEWIEWPSIWTFYKFSCGLHVNLASRVIFHYCPCGFVETS